MLIIAIGCYFISPAWSMVDTVASWGEVVISEVMFDPVPAVDTSLGEFVELYNRSDHTFDIEGWILQSGDRKYPLHEKGKGLLPGDYFVAANITLPNSGATLALFDGKGNLVHAVTYKIPFNGPDWKKEGGWSLEVPDPDRVCIVSESWEYSQDAQGGTPGRMNSCNGFRPDSEPPVFLYPGFGRQGELQLHYSERVEPAYDFHQQVKIQPGNLEADSFIVGSPLGKQIDCYFSRDLTLLPGSTVRLPGLMDCEGNEGPSLIIRVGRVVRPGPGTVLISEIMYDPSEGCPAFIELFHPGPGYSDLQDLMLGIAETGGSPEKYVPLSSFSRLLVPGETVVLTQDERYLRAGYSLERSGMWTGVPDLPSLPRSGGWIYVAGRTGNPVEVAAYRDEMHLDLVLDSKGISLERIDFNKPGIDPSAWNSAGSLEGYSTPGRIPPQKGDEDYLKDLLSLDPRVISPDGDGYHDLLRVTVNPDEAGSVVRIWITRSDGKLVRSLVNNRIGGTGSSCSWNGEDDAGHMVEEGFYIVHMKVYYPASGKRAGSRKVVGVVYR